MVQETQIRVKFIKEFKKDLIQLMVATGACGGRVLISLKKLVIQITILTKLNRGHI